MGPDEPAARRVDEDRAAVAVAVLLRDVSRQAPARVAGVGRRAPRQQVAAGGGVAGGRVAPHWSSADRDVWQPKLRAPSLRLHGVLS